MRLSLKCYQLILRNSRSPDLPCQFPLLTLKGEEQGGVGGKEVSACSSLARVMGVSGRVQPQQAKVSPSYQHQSAKL